MSKDASEAAFESEREVVKTKGLKLQRPKAAQEKIDTERQRRENFENRAEQFFESKNENNIRLVDVTKRFMMAMRDKTLVSNKGTVSSNFEKEIRSDLHKLIQDLDNDESNNIYGEGSEAAIAIFSKVFFEMRDRINELEFELKKLKSVENEKKQG